ncbi:MAG: hypothetical protein HOE48_15525 [Candidatus Latescibacteria bacterium]|jgi:hypothetical protein|nr:hypothetical protein [Candidatus Latescibacterota bacterium]MBT5832573.1 hypothetical protein [Candidatus Latescibacterota bacterium]
MRILKQFFMLGVLVLPLSALAQGCANLPVDVPLPSVTATIEPLAKCGDDVDVRRLGRRWEVEQNEAPEQLLRRFKQADRNEGGFVNKVELVALFGQQNQRGGNCEIDISSLLGHCVINVMKMKGIQNSN